MQSWRKASSWEQLEMPKAEQCPTGSTCTGRRVGTGAARTPECAVQQGWGTVSTRTGLKHTGQLAQAIRHWETHGWYPGSALPSRASLPLRGPHLPRRPREGSGRSLLWPESGIH